MRSGGTRGARGRRPVIRIPTREERAERRAARRRGADEPPAAPPAKRRVPRLVWVTLAAVVAGTLIAMLLRRSDRLNPAQVAPGTVKTADQVRIEEIFKADGNLASDAALDKDYQAINAQYFEGRLPAVKLRWESRLDEVGPLIADGFQMSGVTDGRLILLNPAIQTNPDEVRRILCHEVVHIAVVGEKEPHGPAFQQYLRQLAARGAFKGIVATEAEKQEKRRAIDRRFADLAAEADILAKTKAEIDAASATVDTRTGELKERSDAYNDRVRRHNDAVAELNRSIDDYNLMVTYPDGLDRERLSRRSSVTPIG